MRFRGFSASTDGWFFDSRDKTEQHIQVKEYRNESWATYVGAIEMRNGTAYYGYVTCDSRVVARQDAFFTQKDAKEWCEGVIEADILRESTSESADRKTTREILEARRIRAGLHPEAMH